MHDSKQLGTVTMEHQHVAVTALANGAGAIGGAAARSSLTCGMVDSPRECVMPNVAILAMAGAAAFLIITLSQDVHGEPTWTHDTEQHLCTSPSSICLPVHRHVQAAAGVQLGRTPDHWDSSTRSLKAAWHQRHISKQS